MPSVIQPNASVLALSAGVKDPAAKAAIRQLENIVRDLLAMIPVRNRELALEQIDRRLAALE